VSDLGCAIKFYEDVLGLHRIDEFPGGRGAALRYSTIDTRNLIKVVPYGRAR
jgi:catechol 2,3-dioxygenase-like lactoylglutathione lyase family enzyme